MLRDDGLREVTTPLVVAAPAAEPHIEPLRAELGYLSTSPELGMKRLLCAGSGPIFQLTAAFRRDEVGARHRPEFRLLEWYRLDATLDDTQRDVERLVGAAFAVAGRAEPPWQRVGVLSRLRADLDLELIGTERASALVSALERVSERAGVPLDPRVGAGDSDSATVAAWTELYTLWSVAWFDPWLARQGEVGVHLAEFPPALAALAQVSDGTALRCESFVGGVELANAYVELRDPIEQRRRFDAVNDMRVANGCERLPLDEAFLTALSDPGLPPCAGAALGVDRLVMLAAGRRDLGEILLDDATGC